MNFKRFTSENESFWINLPENWNEYDDGSENTHAFFDSESKKWKGNLRNTQIQWTNVDTKDDKAAEFIMDEWTNNQGAKKIKLGRYDCAHYKKESVQENEHYVIYYWATGTKNNFFLCSFTINKIEENSNSNKIELKIVEDILSSIHLI
jgi:Domain of unknown function (DUF3805)